MMYILNMVIILIVMYCNVVTAIDKIPTYLLRFNSWWLYYELGTLTIRTAVWSVRWGVVEVTQTVPRCR